MRSKECTEGHGKETVPICEGCCVTSNKSAEVEGPEKPSYAKHTGIKCPGSDGGEVSTLVTE